MEDNQPQPTADKPSGGEATPAPAPPTGEVSAPTAPTPTSAPTSPEPTQTVEPPAGGTAPAAPQAPESTPEPVAPERQPRPAQRRIQELVADNKELREQLRPAPIPPIAPQVPRLSEQIKTEVDPVTGQTVIDPNQIDALGKQAYEQGAQLASGTTDLKLAQLRQEMVIRDAINDTDTTAAKLQTEYKELNPNEPNYNDALEAKIVNRFRSMAVRTDAVTGQKFFDPSVKLADVAKEEVEFFRTATEAGKAQSSATLNDLADSSAITPTGGNEVAPEKKFEDMTLSEQEAHLRAKGHDI